MQIVESLDRVGPCSWAQAVAVATLIAGPASAEALVAEMVACRMLVVCRGKVEVR